jgi:nicotinate-nucleotide adenylyltransferase
MGAERIGIYGGTFSPPHLGHINAAENFADALPLDKLIIMPDFLPPHKQYDGLVTANDRLEMSKLAFGHIKNAEISDYEIKKGGKSYTAVTLSDFSAPNRELYFLCGTDMILTLGSWYMPQVIFEHATICYIRRESEIGNTALIKERIGEYRAKFNAKIIEIQAPVKEISSSQVRDAILNGRNIDKYLSPSVHEYILEKGLYK